MKPIRFLLLFLFATLLSACAPAPQPAPDLSAGSMKGYELYSWQQAGQWYFSVLIGTNREKTLAEIQAPQASLKGIEALLPVLKKIPAGQYLTWAAPTGLAFPPDALIGQVQQVCKDQGLQLSILR